jgi:hypothetical protein
MKLDNFSLNDSFEVSAYWWLPEAPEDKVPGTLDFSPSGGAVLTLQGTFNHPDLREIRRLFNDVGFEAERIYGEQADGQRITVCDVFANQISDTCSLRCHLVLAGAHAIMGGSHEPADALFSFDNLEEWTCAPFLQAERASLPDRMAYSFSYEPLQLFSLEKTDICHELSLTMNTTGRLTRNDALFERRAHFRATFQVSEVAQILRFAGDVGQLLTIFMGEPANLCRLRYTLGPDTIDVFFQRVRAASSKIITSPDMPFSLHDLGEQAGSLFSSWLTSMALMRTVYSTFFSTLFNLPFIDTKFQALTQAIEGFHRRTCVGKYLEASEYSKVQDCLEKAIPNDIESGFRERLKNAIKYGNEFSLRRRLKDLIRGLTPKTREILQIDEAFQSVVVEARNYYAHLDEDTKPGCIGDGKALYYLNQKLSALFLILVPKTLGMTENDARDGVIKRRRFSA